MNPDQKINLSFDELFKKLSVPNSLNIILEVKSIEEDAHRFFDFHVNDQDPGVAGDNFFNCIGGLCKILIDRGKYYLAEKIWEESVNIAYNWEDKNAPMKIHKGSAFYFWGGLKILQGDIRKGFLLIHASLEEDKRKHYRQDEDPDTPARKFVTLDSREDNQYLKDLVDIGTKELEQGLHTYRTTTNSMLQFSEFQDRYAKKHEIREIVFIFMMTVFEAHSLRASFKQVDSGKDFAAQLAANCLFDLCQVVEESLRFKKIERDNLNPSKPKKPPANKFIELVRFISNEFTWCSSGDPVADINTQQKQIFDTTIRKLVQNTATAGSPSRLPTNLLERDLWLTYAVRNSTAHDLKSKQVLLEHFDDIYQSILNIQFAVIEKLYL